MTDSYDEKIAKNLREVHRIDLESESIAKVIQKMSMLEEDSREKVLATVQAYYGMERDTWPEELREMQGRMAASTAELRKIIEEGSPRRQPLPGAIPRVTDPEEVALRELVKEFSKAMLDRLLQKSADGWLGWDEPDEETLEDFWERMNKHVARWRESPGNMRDIIDTANFCAFIWHHRRKSG